MKLKKFYILGYFLVALVSCDSFISPPAGQILVKNDSQDREYNIVKLSASGVSYTLKPGDSELLPKGVTKISFSRAYKDHTKQYTIKCPDQLTKGIMIKLIDVHTGRLPGGCKTIAASTQ